MAYIVLHLAPGGYNFSSCFMDSPRSIVPIIIDSLPSVTILILRKVKIFQVTNVLLGQLCHNVMLLVKLNTQVPFLEDGYCNH